VVRCRNPGSGELACEVQEWDITRVEYRFLDELGNAVDGHTRIPVIERELPQQVSWMILMPSCNNLHG